MYKLSYQKLEVYITMSRINVHYLLIQSKKFCSRAFCIIITFREADHHHLSWNLNYVVSIACQSNVFVDDRFVRVGVLNIVCDVRGNKTFWNVLEDCSKQNLKVEVIFLETNFKWSFKFQVSNYFWNEKLSANQLFMYVCMYICV